MGYNKALLRLAGEAKSPTLLDRTMALLKIVCGRAIVIGQNVPGYECFPDRVPGAGPVGGITTALEVTQSACLILPCDLPFMDERILQNLIQAHRERPDGALSTSCIECETRYLQATVAVYETGALPFFQECLARELLKIRLVIPMEQQHFYEYSAEDAPCFFNINTPQALVNARKLSNTP
jgi:molybdopterin-guanine dinucleotide biosynthesis protein A